MPKTQISNFILSKINIDRAKYLFEKNSFLNIFYKIGSQLLIDNQYPTHVFIEATRICNLKCKACPSTIGSAEKGHMDIDLFKKIVDETKPFGRRNFCLHMLGEPLLHPSIIDMVKYIKSINKNHSILLTTNGYFLDDLKAKELLKNNLDKITISLFSIKKEKLLELTGSNDIKRVIDNIRHMSSLKKELQSKTKIFIRFLLCDENKEELDDIQSLSSDLGVILEIRKTHNYSGVIENNLTMKSLPRERYPCYHLWFSHAITWDGKVVLCCDDWNYSEVLGDIKEKSMSEIWQGERLKIIRKLHLQGNYREIPVCSKCNVWSVYPDIFLKYQKRE